MNCDFNGYACSEPYIYQNGGSGYNHDWFYANVPGEAIHWSPDAVCAIEKYLLGSGYKCN
jgi:hypothetical protein